MTNPAPSIGPREAMERLNSEAAQFHIWLRTQANAPAQPPWFRDTGLAAGGRIAAGRVGAAQLKPVAHHWRWNEISPYLDRIAEIARGADISPIEFAERQQFLLTNPGLGGRLQVTGTMRCAVSIYNPGDVAPVHIHTPNASRTILSDKGGYTTIDGERCEAARGDLILTPNGTWHDHGNDGVQPVVWIDGTVAALGAARFVACPLDAETPLPERGLAIGLEPLRGGDSGGELCRLEGGDEGPRDGLVDLDAADVEAIDAAALDQDLAGAMIPRRGAASAIVRVQAASAVPAGGKALQQSAPFPHGAARFVRSGAGILGDAILIGLIGPPIDEARMMVRNKHLPLGARQFSNTLFADARCIQHRLPT